MRAPALVLLLCVDVTASVAWVGCATDAASASSAHANDRAHGNEVAREAEANGMVSTGLQRKTTTSPAATTLPTPAMVARDDAKKAPEPAIATPASGATATDPARTPASRETQLGARARASSASSSLEAQLRAKLPSSAPAESAPATPAADADAARDPKLVEYESKLAAYESAFGEHKKLVDDYWKNMKATRARGEYVSEQPPPKYAGPAKPAHPYPTTTTPEPPPPSTIPTKQTFVDAARDVYGFAPEQAAESAFKQSYAKEALKHGLSAEQVAKVYAFETGGDGKFDLQPIRKDGTAISTALGYAQLLNANSVVMMAKHGETFAKALDDAGKPEKAAVVRRMAEDARKVPDHWDAYQQFAKTPAGRAMHAANLDVDIGPKMQMQKVKDIVTAAKKAGHESLSPAQLELLNLAGEKQGLLMLKDDLKQYPTSNFFDRAGYEANPVVHQRTGEALLARIHELMTKNIAKPGAQDLLAAFAAAGSS